MKNEVYDKLRGLVTRIDGLNTSANDISEMLESLSKNGGQSKFIVYTNGKSITTELSKSLSETVGKEILECYHNLIKEAQKEMNGIISGLYADTEV